MSDQLAIHFSSVTPEWYTPQVIVRRVVDVLGAIDLDPCADPGKSVPAACHFTAKENGLLLPWRGRTFVNPPYGDGIGVWVNKLRGEYAEGRVTAAIALLPARTDTAWMYPLLRDYAVCFIRGRLKFSGHESGAPFPSAAVYLGPDAARFDEVFSACGVVMRHAT